jgi:hypothetical protein
MIGLDPDEPQAQVGGHPDSRIEVHPAENRGSDQDTSEDLLIRRLLNVIMTDPTRRIAGSLADSIRQYLSADYAQRRGSFLRDPPHAPRQEPR